MARGLDMGSAGIALLGLLAVKGFQHRDELGKMLGDITSGNNNEPGAAQANNPLQGGLGGVLGGLGSLLGGQSNGAALNNGLGGLLDRFQQNGHANEAQEWVTTGANTANVQHLEAALGDDVIDHLQQQTGLSRAELLERLSTNLPKTIDQLTPDGRLPTAEEANRLTPSAI